MLLGAALGAAVSGVLLLVGLGRAALGLLGGRVAPPAANDLRWMAAYVAAFAVGGALVGAARPLLSSRAGVYAILAIAGAVVMNAIAIGDRGLAAQDAVDWLAMSLLGIVFGLAAARGFLGKP